MSDVVEDKKQSRKWLITVNNPDIHGYTHEYIKSQLLEIKSLVYYCMADERGGEEQTLHTHCYVVFTSAVRMSTLKSKLYKAHYDFVNGTSQQNRDYVFKEGKWLNDKEKGTNYKDTHEEHGEMPVERQGKRNDLDDLYDMIKSGLSDYEIMETDTRYMLNLDKIERIRQKILNETYSKTERDLKVTYVYGKPGTGKTSTISKRCGYGNFYKITDYSHSFDGYKGEKVIIFDEFSGQINIQLMNNLIDRYPVELPCRYNNKQACYNEVYIISNIHIKEIYKEYKIHDIDIYEAFIRRIHLIETFNSNYISTIVNRKDVYKIESEIERLSKDDIEFKQINIKDTPFCNPSIDNTYIAPKAQ